jgi:hypothetical protein
MESKKISLADWNKYLHLGSKEKPDQFQDFLPETNF